MPGDRLVAEAGGEALEEGLGERDLGEQHQRLPPAAQRLGDRLEIDFGLARSGDPVEQEGRELGGPHRLDEDCAAASACAGSSSGGAWSGSGSGKGSSTDTSTASIAPALTSPRITPSDTPAAIASSRTSPCRSPIRSSACARCARQPLRNEAGGAIFGDRPPALERARRGEGHAQHRGERRQIIIGGPLDQPAKRLGQRRQVVGLEQRPQAVVADRLRLEPVRLPDHAGQLARPERREHDRARLDLHALRHAIVERPQSGVEQEDAAAVHPRLDRVPESETQLVRGGDADSIFSLSRFSRERSGPPRSGGR